MRGFEDEGVAAVMNEHFVNIKVDREERPDIDAIYMSALHLLGQQGGWPLTMFLTPEGEPFWGGTYFPKDAAYGRPGFTDVLTEVARIFREEPAKVYKNRTALTKALEEQSATARPGEPTPQVPVVVAEKLTELMDPENGGIRGAPKFPQVPLLTLLWRAHLRTGREEFAAPVTRALDHMSEGGIYDHLGGGFARYSVDEFWLAPHFEKMLYDNALLIDLLTLAWAETRKPLYERRVRETIEWIAREMTVDGGAFAASLDADSEGVEGKFYVWSEAEIDNLFTPGEATLFKRFYGVTAEGNWEHTNILNRLARADAPVTAEEEAALEPLKARAFAERDLRVKPGFDDKVLADWNGLAIAALARAGATFGEAEWVEMAAGAFRFVMETMRPETNGEGRLHHAWRAARLQHIAMADDLANMADAAIALAEATGDEGYVAEAESLVAELDAHYRDTANGGYFFTADDAPALIVRRRTVADDATAGRQRHPAGHADEARAPDRQGRLFRPRRRGDPLLRGRIAAEHLSAGELHREPRHAAPARPGRPDRRQGGNGGPRGRGLRDLPPRPHPHADRERERAPGGTPGAWQGTSGRQADGLCLRRRDLLAAGDGGGCAGRGAEAGAGGIAHPARLMIKGGLWQRARTISF